MLMIRKGIVLAAGKGTRLAPLTLAIPKEMIRIGAKPVVEHAIEVLRAGGVKDLLVIVGRRKEAIIDYLGSGERLAVDISYKIQEEPLGTANAVSLGKSFTGDEDFAVMYGDNYLKPPEVMKDVLEFHTEKVADATLVLHRTKDPTRFGVVKVDTKNVVLGMLEKPTLEEAEPYKVGDAYLNIAGLLVLKPTIFDFIKRTEPGREGELWLTDSVELMRRNGKRILGFMFEGTRYDVGTFESLMEADRLEQLRR